MLNKKEQVNLYLEPEVDEHLEILAKKTRRSKGAMVAYLVDRAYERIIQRDRVRRLAMTRATRISVADKVLGQEESASSTNL